MERDTKDTWNKLAGWLQDLAVFINQCNAEEALECLSEMKRLLTQILP